MSAIRPTDRFSHLSSEEMDLLRARARQVAGRTEGRSDEGLIEVLEVESRGQAFAFPLSAVEGVSELLSIATLSRVPPYVKGLVNYRGQVMVGVELASVVGGVGTGFADLRRVISITASGRRLAILAERAMSVRTIAQSSFQGGSIRRSPYIIGTDEKLCSLLDLGLLVDHIFQGLARKAL